MKRFWQWFLQTGWAFFVFAAFLPVYAFVAQQNESRVDYLNNGFFTFWLGGQMPWTPAHPYSSADWVGGHHQNGATWIPNQIFPYPLPLSLLTAPLGLLPIASAYLLWDFLAQALMALCIFWLVFHYWQEQNQRRFVIVVLLAALLNGNIFLGLMTGTVAALFLLFLTLSLYFLETNRPWAAGIALAMLALKPPLLTVVFLLGFWFLLRRQGRVLGGVALGGGLLLAVGWLQDPQWVQKFLGAGQNLLSLRIGNQPTLLSYTRLFCAGEMTCAWGLYAALALALSALYAALVWQKRESLTPLTVFSAALPLGVLLPPYLWSYDYAILLIPIVFIGLDLVRRRKTYLFSVLFLLVLDFLSLLSLTLFWLNPESAALTIQRDMWSIGVAALILIVSWGLVFRPVQVVEK